jgi:hypothetical protein
MKRILLMERFFLKNVYIGTSICDSCAVFHHKEHAMIRQWILVIFLVVLLSACSIVQVNEPGNGLDVLPANEDKTSALVVEAEAALTEFYNLLNQGEYEKAVELYGGSYEELEYFNPVMDPADRAGLLAAACEINGFICAPVLNVAAIGSDPQGILAFEVVYANPDGSRFVLGPCCGATEEEMPPMEVFTVRVNCERENECQVLDMPPWVP